MQLIADNPWRVRIRVIAIDFGFLPFISIHSASPQVLWKNFVRKQTRFGPNSVAADMEGNREFDNLMIYEDFWINS